MLTKIIEDSINFTKEISNQKEAILELARRELKAQYMGTFLGFVWVYLQPLLFITVIYFVFTLGFRVSPVETETPYAVWLLSGMVAWLFFSSYVSGSAFIVSKYAFLVKKVDFSLNVLPLVKLLSESVPHLVFIFIAIIIAFFNGITPSLYVLQCGYYFIAMCLLVTGIGWLTSATNLFIQDVAKVLQLVVQFGLWLTPIFWNSDQVSNSYKWIIELNPMAYIVNGYRDSLIYQVGFWEHPIETAYFWVVCLSICIAGARIFGRLRPHFAEVI